MTAPTSGSRGDLRNWSSFLESFQVLCTATAVYMHHSALSSANGTVNSALVHCRHYGAYACLNSVMICLYYSQIWNYYQSKNICFDLLCNILIATWWNKSRMLRDYSNRGKQTAMSLRPSVYCISETSQWSRLELVSHVCNKRCREHLIFNCICQIQPRLIQTSDKSFPIKNELDLYWGEGEVRSNFAQCTGHFD
jgi:hypothetical protein